MSKINRFKRWAAVIGEDKNHHSYLEIAENGDFTVGEEYEDIFNAKICIRSAVAPTIIALLSDPNNWKFDDDLPEDETDNLRESLVNYFLGKE